MQEKSKIFLIWVKGKDLKNFKGSKVLKDNKGRKGRRKGRNEPAYNAELFFQFGVEGGDDETAESGIELAGGRVTVVLAVGGVAMFPFRFLCGIFEDG